MKGPDMTDTKAIAAQLEQALMDRSESRFNSIAFVHRHEIIAALSRPPVASDGGEAERIATVLRCAKVVRELGPSGSPGATAAAMERNAAVLAREAKPEELAAALSSPPPIPEPGEVTEGDEALACEIADAANIVSHDGYYEMDTDAAAAVLARHYLKFSAARRDEDVGRDDYYADPKVIGPELRRRKTDAQVTKKALFRARKETRHEREN